jgi:hypothetical protein
MADAPLRLTPSRRETSAFAKRLFSTTVPVCMPL